MIVVTAMLPSKARTSSGASTGVLPASPRARGRNRTQTRSPARLAGHQPVERMRVGLFSVERPMTDYRGWQTANASVPL